MKICEKCGAHQSDDRSTCLDCGAILGKPLSEEEERELNEDISDTLHGMSERTEDFYVSPPERVLGILSIVLAIAMVILLNVYSVQKSALREQLPDDSFRFGSSTVIITADGRGVTGSAIHNTIWDRIEACDTAMTYCLTALICHIFAALNFLVPKAMWFLDTLRYRLWFDGEYAPSDYWLITTKIAKYVIFALGILLSAGAFVHLF